MGWFSSTPPATAPPEPTQGPQTPESLPESSAAQTPAPSKAPSRDETAEDEVQSFLSELNTAATVSSTKYNRTPKNQSPTSNQIYQADEKNESLQEQLLPREMSCRTAFDEAFYCNSFGGRFNDIYRYGTVKSCSDTWSKFWFCMRTRGYGGVQKDIAIKEFYAKQEYNKYSKQLGKDSSEDVWKSREKKVEPGTAFVGVFPDFGGSDEEWREQERAWRKKAKESAE